MTASCLPRTLSVLWRDVRHRGRERTCIHPSPICPVRHMPRPLSVHHYLSCGGMSVTAAANARASSMPRRKCTRSVEAG